MNDTSTLVALIESVRDDLRGDVQDLRASVAEVRAEVRHLATRPLLPAWVRGAAIAAMTAAVGAAAGKYTATVWPARSASVTPPAPSAVVQSSP